MSTSQTNNKAARRGTARGWLTRFQNRQRTHDPREARAKGSQFEGTGWIAPPVHVPVSLRRLAMEERLPRKRSESGDPMLVLNMSIFNSASGWDRIFNPLKVHENVT